jgi:hypothetical protein
MENNHKVIEQFLLDSGDSPAMAIDNSLNHGGLA